MQTKSLVDLAFSASYKEVIDNLLLILSLQPFLNSSLISLKPSVHNFLKSLTNESIVKFVKERLDTQLIGHIGFRMRERMAEKFFEPPHRHHSTQIQPDVVTFLDCVVNQHFMDICIYNPEMVKLNTILDTVLKQSSAISTLQLTCANKWTLISPVREMLPDTPTGLLQALKKFSNLTSLKMDFLSSDSSLLLLNQLGITCPQLTHLCLGSFFFENDHILALVLGGRDAILPENVIDQVNWGTENNSVHLLEFNPMCLSPLCNTLKILELNNHDPPDERVKPFEFPSYYMPQSTFAFAFRHLRNLEVLKQGPYMSYSYFAAYAVQILHQSLQVESAVREETIIHRRNASNIFFLKWTFDSPFNGEKITIPYSD